MEIIREEKAAAMIGVTVDELRHMRAEGFGPKYLPLPREIARRVRVGRMSEPAERSYSDLDIAAYIAERDAMPKD